MEGAAAQLAVVAVLLVVAALFVYLGQWQLQRAAQNSARIQRFESTAAEPALTQAVDDSALEDSRYRRLQVHGNYEPQLQFLLDNSVQAGDVGYQVLTPFRVSGSDRLLLVNRGWLKADADRRVLPDLRVAAEPRELAGRIDILPRPGLVLGAASGTGERHGDVVVVTHPAAADLAAALNYPTFGYQVLLDAEQPEGFARDWQPAGIGPERNLAYAGQWFLFALGAAGVALVMGVRVVRARPRLA